MSNYDDLQLDLIDVAYNVILKGKRKKNLLSNVNLHVKSGEICAIMGPSGSGIVDS